MNTNTNVVVVGQGQEPVSIGFVHVMLLCAFVAFVASYFWQIVIIALIGFVGFIFWTLFRDQELRAKELAARADEQNLLYMQGDPRGVYGDPDAGLES